MSANNGNSEGVTITRLEVEAFKRLKAVRLEVAPTGNVLVKGMNGNGKTSTLDAIWATLGGGRAVPPDAVHHGEPDGWTALTLSSGLFAKRTYRNGKSELSVVSADGETLKSPQGVLDKLCQSIAFDPLEFTRMDERKQVDTLKKAMGLDFAELDKARNVAYTSRTELGRELKRATGVRDDFPREVRRYPEAEVSTGEIVAKLTAARDHNARLAGFAAAVETAGAMIQTRERAVADAQLAVQRALEALEVRKSELSEAVESRAAALAAVTAGGAPLDLIPLQAEVESIDGTNAKARARKTWEAACAEVEAFEKESAALTAEIEEIDAEKRVRVAASPFQIEGVGFSDDGVTFRGVPLSQASGAELLRLSVAVGLALNPTLRVLLIRDGSLLDDSNLAMVAEMANTAGAQVWIERVGKGGAAGIVIEDGEVEEIQDPAMAQQA